MDTSSTLTPPVDPKPTRRARWLSAARVVWLIFALLVVGMVSIGSVIRYREQQQVCTTSTAVCFEAQRLTPSRLVGVTDTKKALQFHALFFLTLNGLQRAVCWSIAFLLFWRRSDDWMALLVGVYLLVIGNTGPQVSAANAYPLLWPLASAVAILSNAIFGLLFCIFPNGRFVPRWSRWLALLGGIYAVASPWLIFPQGPPLWFIIGFFLLYAASVYVQVYRYRKASMAIERRQTKWVVYGVVVWALLSIATDVLVISGPARDAPISPRFYLTIIGFNLTILAIPLCLSVAILRYRLFDIDLLINRTLVYGVLTAGLVGVYIAIVVGLGTIFQTQDHLLVSLFATGLIAVIFQTARDRLQRRVNRLMYGQRDEPYAVLARLGLQLEGAIEPAAAMPLTVETVARALKLPYVAIRLKQAGTLQTAAAFGVAPVKLEHFPLVYAGDNLGELVVATRAPAEPLASADRRLLGDLARRIGVTAHARMLAAKLEHARLQIVVAHEETRRRLGSDLHDGVGHQLAGLVRRVEMATTLVEHDATQARAMLAEITGQLNAAMDQVRGLAHQLHPPELELLGLAGALRERAQIHTGFVLQIDAPDTLPPLPTAVETAAYYITLAALANVEKHAGAQACTVRLALTSGEDGEPAILELDVTDDGRGLPAQTDVAGGLGLLSMQARAVEVGGVCRFEARPGGGTRVIVRLPCSVPGE